MFWNCCYWRDDFDISWDSQMAMDGGTMIDLPEPFASREREEVKTDLYTADQMIKYGEDNYLSALSDFEKSLDKLTSYSSWRIADVYYAIKLLKRKN